MRKLILVLALTTSLLGLASVPAMASWDGPNHWIVEKGETLSIIGSKTGNTWQDLCEWNRDQISNCDVIYPKERLRLFAPQEGSAPANNSGEGTYHGRTSIDTWERLAQCESSGDWHINTGNGYYGGVQISKPTWDGYNGNQFASYPHRTGKYNQMTVAQRILDGQGWNAWPYCSRQIGMR